MKAYMFGNKIPQSITSLIARGSHIAGDICFSGGLRIDGEVTGDIRTNSEHVGLLVLADSAQVIGTVLADHIIINGTVKGSVFALHLLELQPKARIEGDVHYAALEMHQGALIIGMLQPLLENEENLQLSLKANSR
jgi:cytoskeletal protein CcmA (bactofilin family)